MNTSLNWRVVGMVSLLGVVMGVASLFGLTQNYEFTFWLIIAVGAAILLSRLLRHRLFLHGMVTGLLMGVINSVCQSIFLDMYLASNPSTQQSLSAIPGGIHAGIFVLIAGAAIGIMYGVALGGLTVLAARILPRKH